LLQTSTEETLDIGKIRTDGGTQNRLTIDQDVVANYEEAMREGAEFPPPVVFFDGTEYWLADGFHRRKAMVKLGKATIKVLVFQGTKREAILYSAGANATHGLPRSNADKRKAVIKLLTDEEWTLWSDRVIAGKCAVSQPFVSGIRKEASENGYQMPEQHKANRGGKVITQSVRSRSRPASAVDPSPSEEGQEKAEEKKPILLPATGTEVAEAKQEKTEAEPQPNKEPEIRKRVRIEEVNPDGIVERFTAEAHGIFREIMVKLTYLNPVPKKTVMLVLIEKLQNELSIFTADS